MISRPAAPNCCTLTVISRAKLFDGELFVGEFLPFVRRPDDVEVFVELFIDGRTTTILERLHAGILTVAIHPVVAGLDHVLEEELEKKLQREIMINVGKMDISLK